MGLAAILHDHMINPTTWNLQDFFGYITFFPQIKGNSTRLDVISHGMIVDIILFLFSKFAFSQPFEIFFKPGFYPFRLFGGQRMRRFDHCNSIYKGSKRARIDNTYKPTIRPTWNSLSVLKMWGHIGYRIQKPSVYKLNGFLCIRCFTREIPGKS